MRQKKGLLNCLIKFELVTLMMMEENYSRQYLYMNLVRITQKMPCLYTQRISLPSLRRNEVVKNDLPCDLYTSETKDKISDNCKYRLAAIQAIHNEEQTNAGDLAKLLK